MFDTSGSLGLANDPSKPGGLAAPAGQEQDFRLPGLLAGAIWAIGLVVGVVTFATGHTWIAVVALATAVLAPWAGLAWVSHAHREAYNIALPAHD